MTATDLRKIIDGDLEALDVVEYEGFFLMNQGTGRYDVQLDGHAGSVYHFNEDEFEDPLELVDELNDLWWMAFELEMSDDRQELIDWAGRIMTENEERAEEEPETYVYIPPLEKAYDESEHDSLREELGLE